MTPHTPCTSGLRVIRTILRLALVVFVVSCRSEAGSRPASESVTDSAGVELVHNRDAAVDTLRVALVEELRIGQAEGPEHYQLHMVRGAAIDALGRIYVSDGSNSVHVYDSSGAWVRDIGRAGSGPGEFENIREPLLRGNTLAVWDGNTRQFAIFDTSGLLVTSVALALRDRSVIFPMRAALFGWSVGRVWFPARRAPVRGALRQDTLVFAHLSDASLLAVPSLTSAQLDSALRGVVRWPAARLYEDADGYSQRPLFESEFTVAHDDSGRVYLTNAYPYDIHIYDASGQLVRRIRREYEPHVVTQRDVDEWLRLVNQRVPGSGPGEGGPSFLERERRRAEGPRAESFPVIGRLIASATGELWAQRSDVHIDLGEWAGLPNRTPLPAYWDVFDRTGRYEFTVRLPARTRPLWIEHRSFLALQRDENDVETIVRYRLIEDDSIR